MAHTWKCHACFRRSLNALLSMHAPLRRSPLKRPCSGALYSTSSRRQSTAYRAGAPEDAYLDSKDSWYQKSDASLALRTKRSKPDAAMSEERERALKTELKYLRDPLKLADHVAYVLSRDDEEKALGLVRLSSRARQNVVSWNRLIDWRMKKGKVSAAMESYNEMKKRAQKPDSYTYLLLLRGLGDHAHHPTSLAKALSLYHAISGPRSDVAPTVMHTNAVLKVCARAGDMDSMWDIASRLPERGPHAADNLTFTTILNNMRMQALTGGPNGETEEETAIRRDGLITEGRRLWQVITKRWRAGDLLIDEELACSMSRLLLVGGRPHDWDDILSLLEQTMNLPRLIPRLGTVERRDALEPRIRAPSSPKAMVEGAYLVNESSNAPKPGAELHSDTFSESNNGGPLTGLQRPPANSNTTVRKSVAYAYARPGNSTLSLVLEACLKMVAKKAALQYWHLLTDVQGQFAIPPDLDNMHKHLRILRQARSSTEAVVLLRDHFPAANLKPTPKSFHIALATCLRDAENKHAYNNAENILALALQTLADPGAATYRLFIFTVNKSRPDAPTLVRALRCLEEGFRILRSAVNYGTTEQSKWQAAKQKGDRERTPAEKASHMASLQREREELKTLMKAALATYDRTIDTCAGREEQMGVTVRDIQHLRIQKSKLSAFMATFTSRLSAEEFKQNGWRGLKVKSRPRQRVRSPQAVDEA